MPPTTRPLRSLALPLLFAPVIFVCSGGCSGQVTGASTLTLTSVSPQVICDPAVAITITGTGFAPLPTNLLGGAPALAAPRVVLNGAGNADAGTAMGPDVKIDETEHVHFLSATTMSFDLTPDLMLAGGTYSITVTVPSTPTVQEQTLTNAFVVIPPPSIDKVSADTIHVNCDGTDQDQGYDITGGGFVQVGMSVPSVTFTGSDMMPHTFMPAVIGCSDLGTFGGVDFQLCNEMRFMVPSGTLAAGDSYMVSVVNPMPLSCTGMMGTYKKPAAPIPPTISSISPTMLCANSTTLTVNGAGYIIPGMTVMLAGQGVGGMGNATALMLDWSTNPVGMMPTLVAGTSVPLVLTNPDTCSVTKMIPVGGGNPPWFVDAKYAYTGVATPISIFTSGLMGMPSAHLEKSGGGLPADLGASVDPNHPDRALGVVPAGLAAGAYDLVFTGAGGCPSTLAKAVTVVAAPKVITSVSPATGYNVASTKLTITTPAMAALSAPRVYLSPTGGGTATALLSSATTSATTVSALVPPGLDPAGNPYDVVVIDSDGTVYKEAGAFTSTTNPAPHIDSISPPFIAQGATSAITITGENFRGANMVPPSVTLVCSDGSMVNAVTATFKPTSVTINPPVLMGIMGGTTCLVRVTNGDDKSTADYQALGITDANGLPAGDTKGPMLSAARRAPAVAMLTTGTMRVVCAAGGDNGTPISALATVECADVSGVVPGPFVVQGNKLVGKRTLAGGAGIGRYFYVVGGDDSGAASSALVERATLLDPAGAPEIVDWDVTPTAMAATGITAGSWIYRVSARFDMNDPDNPGGESLPSDPLTVTLPSYVVGQATVSLTVSAVPGAVGYIIYRSPMANAALGSELLADMTAATTWTDAGKMPMGVSPLVPGTLGAFAALPMMNTPRESPSVVVGVDPGNANRAYLYVIGGRSGSPGLGTYELLPINIANGSGAQTLDMNAAWIAGKSSLINARFLASAWSVTAAGNSNVMGTDDYVYIGGGTADSMTAVSTVEVAKVAAGGDLGSFSLAGLMPVYGTAQVSGGNQLLTFGGVPSASAIEVSMIGMPPAIGQFNPAVTTLNSPRYAAGAAAAGPVVYVIGGSDVGGNGPSSSTEWMVY